MRTPIQESVAIFPGRCLDKIQALHPVLTFVVLATNLRSKITPNGLNFSRTAQKFKDICSAPQKSMAYTNIASSTIVSSALFGRRNQASGMLRLKIYSLRR